MQTGILARWNSLAVGLSSALLLASSAQAQQPAPRPLLAAPAVDHHFHLGSAALSAYVEKINQLDPSVFEHLSVKSSASRRRTR